MNLNFDKTDRLIEIIQDACRVLMRIKHLASTFLNRTDNQDYQALYNKLVEITSGNDDEATKNTKRENAFAEHYQRHGNNKIDGKGMLTYTFDEIDVIKDISRVYWEVQSEVTYRPSSDPTPDELKKVISEWFPDEPHEEIAEQVLLKKEPTIKDLEAEFWTNCPDVDQIDAFCNIYRERWRGHLKQVDVNYYDFEALLFDETNKLHRGLTALRKCGLLSINERFFEARLRHIAQNINYRCDSVIKMFQKMRASTKPTESPLPSPIESLKVTSEILIDKQQCREIDVETLKPYFTPVFKGVGNGNIDYFSMMVEELKTDRNAKEFAQIALMAYDGGKMSHRKPSSFSKWYGIFCECAGCSKKTYQPKDLRNPSQTLTSLFNYLQ